MAQGLTARIVGLAGNDPLFARIRQEAEEAMRREPELATFLMTTILNHRHAGERGRLPGRRAARQRRRVRRADPPDLSTRRSRATHRSAKRSAPTSWRSPTAIPPASG